MAEEEVFPPSYGDAPDGQDPQVDNGGEDDEVGEGGGENERKGTISSARFNVLATMVGGGSLSMPLAFIKSGNGLVGPLILMGVAMISEFCFRLLIGSARMLAKPAAPTTTSPSPASSSNPTSNPAPGKDSFESVAAAAFGHQAYAFSAALVTLMCFFGTVGYAVLLRDMLEPISDAIFPPSAVSNVTTGSMWLQGASNPTSAAPSFYNNITMWAVVLLVTPLCVLRTLTALQRFGAASMFSILVLGSCIFFRSVECNWKATISTSIDYHWTDSFVLFPHSWHDILDVIPLYISCYVCHYNILTVHNELQSPTHRRVSWWLRSTTWSATLFYAAMGLAGSSYGRCIVAARDGGSGRDHHHDDGGSNSTNTTLFGYDSFLQPDPTSSPLPLSLSYFLRHEQETPGQVHGNILLDFDENDPLLLVGRMCLAVTLAMAFPMLTIPARDIILRCLPETWLVAPSAQDDNDDAANNSLANGSGNVINPISDGNDDTDALLRAPLMADEEDSQEEGSDDSVDDNDHHHHHHDRQEEEVPVAMRASLRWRLCIAVLALWSATAVASCVSSIDVVWDLLGSSLSILLSYLIPCGSFLVIAWGFDKGRLGRQELGGAWGGGHEQESTYYDTAQEVEEELEDEPEEEPEAAQVQEGPCRRYLGISLAWVLVLLSAPLMVVSTANAIYNTFF